MQLRILIRAKGKLEELSLGAGLEITSSSTVGLEEVIALVEVRTILLGS